MSIVVYRSNDYYRRVIWDDIRSARRQNDLAFIAAGWVYLPHDVQRIIVNFVRMLLYQDILVWKSYIIGAHRDIIQNANENKWLRDYHNWLNTQSHKWMHIQDNCAVLRYSS